MKRKTATALIITVILLASFSFDLEARKAKTIAFVGATLIDGTGSAPVDNAVVIIEGKKIKAVGPESKVKIPEKAKVIDVSGKYILPGFIDLHVHLTYPTSTDMFYTDSGSLQTIRALRFMNKYLRAGVTSVRDVASDMEPMKALVRAEAQRMTKTIRLFSVGEGITSTGPPASAPSAWATGRAYGNLGFRVASTRSEQGLPVG